ncbi:ferritin-like domain-containing protein [Salegentibacter sediminis]|uniref:ferritin-like domain-containing protein n=1 Tax=Salegentibacter sediminis TaxID=1930251 RepID=UPI0009C08C47|nr:PA2169 family four-helix-bundle protein [Salegentibacter sediminis]
MKTTREAAKEDSQKERIHSLQELLEKNYDAEKGYKKTLEEADNVNLKEFLKKQAIRRNRFATEIHKAIRALNAEPKEKGSATADLHRTWIDLKTLFTKNDDEAVLEECLRGEKASLKEYEEKLKKTEFTPETKAMLEKHLQEIRTTVSEIQNLEDLAD